MIYTNQEIQNIKDNAVCCFGDTVASMYNKMALGKNYNNDRLKSQKVLLYLSAIETWVQASDGSIPSNVDNVLSEEQKDAILSRLQSLCNCGCESIDTGAASGSSRYVVDGYVTDGYLVIK